jgi:hypothetical protein
VRKEGVSRLASLSVWDRDQRINDACWHSGLTARLRTRCISWRTFHCVLDGTFMRKRMCHHRSTCLREKFEVLLARCLVQCLSLIGEPRDTPGEPRDTPGSPGYSK